MGNGLRKRGGGGKRGLGSKRRKQDKVSGESENMELLYYLEIGLHFTELYATIHSFVLF